MFPCRPLWHLWVTGSGWGLYEHGDLACSCGHMLIVRHDMRQTFVWLSCAVRWLWDVLILGGHGPGQVGYLVEQEASIYLEDRLQIYAGQIASLSEYKIVCSLTVIET